jgi:hypothetical protein
MRSIIRGVALVAAIFAFGAVAANAQINYGAEVNIPFEFNIGEKAYEAGKYSVKINKQMVAGVALTIQKVGTDKTQTILLSNSGGERSGEVQLVFNSLDGRRYLAGITTSNEALALFHDEGAKTRLAKLQKPKGQRNDQ